MVRKNLLIEINCKINNYIALKKRPIDSETVEKFISKLSRNLEETWCKMKFQHPTIGKFIMDGLKEFRSSSLCSFCFSL